MLEAGIRAISDHSIFFRFSNKIRRRLRIPSAEYRASARWRDESG
jgi:hypothetical protein